jgi:hypothetical protein
MEDEILVKYEGLAVEGEDCTPVEQYTITSCPHQEAMSLIKAGATYDKITNKGVLFTDYDLQAFKKLGYAVCNNTLDCYGRKVYIYHNSRTFREKKNLDK